MTNLQYQIDRLRENVEDLSSKVALISGGKSTITLSLKDDSGNPIKKVQVNGISSESGGVVYSNDLGIISGYVAEGDWTLSLSGYADLDKYSQQYSFIRGNSYSYTWTIKRKNYVSFRVSGNVRFSGNVKSIAYSLVGGGGGGSACFVYDREYGRVIGGAGGGGGHSVTGTATITPNSSYSFSIGGGGTGGTIPAQSGFAYIDSYRGSDGGNSTFIGMTANGGYGGGKYATISNYTALSVGGNGNGDGGDNGNDGKMGTELYYSDYTSDIACGGGGGGGDKNGGGGVQPKGGSPNGGDGGYMIAISKPGQEDGGSGSIPGGGGGGGTCNYGWHGAGNGGSGGAGILAIRMYF